MTLVDIFIHIIDGFEFNKEKVDNLLNKAEDIIYTTANTILTDINKI